MIVATTSCTLNFAFKNPGMIPHKAPPSKAAPISTTRKRGRGRKTLCATNVAQRPPMSICPEAPILNNPVLNAKATESPTSIKVVAVAMVLPMRSIFIKPPRNKYQNPVNGLLPIKAIRIAPASSPRTVALAATRKALLCFSRCFMGFIGHLPFASRPPS